MIATWMATAIGVTIILALVGVTASPIPAFFKLPRRWFWLALMLASTLLPLGMALWQPRTRDMPMNPATAPAAVIETSVLAGDPPAPSHAVDRVLLSLWGVASATLLVVLGLTHRRALLQLATWETRALFGERVWVSPDYGPAAVGLLRARVVLPEWVFALSPEEQHLVLLHEQQHIRAGDQLLLLGGIALVVLMPWNAGLWWQLQRLRVAMELDCDARVAPNAADRPIYSRMLLKASGKEGSYHTALAFTQTPSALVERLSALLEARRPSNRALIFRATLAMAALVLISLVPVPHVVPSLSAMFSRPQEIVKAPVPLGVPAVPPVVAFLPPKPSAQRFSRGTVRNLRGASTPDTMSRHISAPVTTTVKPPVVDDPLAPVDAARSAGAAPAQRIALDSLGGFWRPLGNGDSVYVTTARRGSPGVGGRGSIDLGGIRRISADSQLVLDSLRASAFSGGAARGVRTTPDSQSVNSPPVGGRGGGRGGRGGGPGGAAPGRYVGGGRGGGTAPETPNGPDLH